MGKWRRHSREFKQQVVEKMKTSDNLHELARELGIERKLMYTWKYQFEGRHEKNHTNLLGTTPSETVENRLRRENKELKEALGEKAAQIDFLTAALRRVKADRLKTSGNADPACTPRSGRTPQRKAD